MGVNTTLLCIVCTKDAKATNRKSILFGVKIHETTLHWICIRRNLQVDGVRISFCGIRCHFKCVGVRVHCFFSERLIPLNVIYWIKLKWQWENVVCCAVTLFEWIVYFYFSSLLLLFYYSGSEFICCLWNRKWIVYVVKLS